MSGSSAVNDIAMAARLGPSTGVFALHRSLVSVGSWPLPSMLEQLGHIINIRPACRTDPSASFLHHDTRVQAGHGKSNKNHEIFFPPPPPHRTPFPSHAEGTLDAGLGFRV